MTRIDFAFGAHHRLRVACQVVLRHYRHGRKMVAYSRQPKVLERFDLLLWSFEPTVFIPHTLADDALAPASSVILTPALPCLLPEDEPWTKAWLLNLDTHCPPNTESFSRVLEIVSNHPDDKKFARERWTHYKQQGFTVNAHDISAKQH